MSLAGKKIIIGITASIAAYKIPFVVRLLKKAGAEVQIILTPAAHDFVTPLTLSTLSENPVLTDFFDPKDGSWASHIDLGLWADLFLVAPVSANTMAKMAVGVADNLLLTTVLSSRCPIYFAPAMDLDMYKHPTTQANISKLQSFGYKLIKPVEGELASGLKGCGRMEEPENIVEVFEDFFKTKKYFSGKRVLITAGPTHEPIDPVRYIGNHSSGKMGYELAEIMSGFGAKVDLVSGPSQLNVVNPNIKLHKVITAEEMYSACNELFADSDITIMAAAVADYTPQHVSDKKIKKEDEKLDNIGLVPTKDILLNLGKRKKQNQLLIGFALETNDEVDNAIKKLDNKNLDMIVLNSLNDEGAGFGFDTNKISIITKSGKKKEFGLKPKSEVALDIAETINELTI